MNVSVIMTVRKSFPIFLEAFGRMDRQLQKGDQLIVANYGGPNLKINSDTFSEESRFIYYEEKTTEVDALNKVMVRFVNNDIVVVLDGSCYVPETYIENVKKYFEYDTAVMGAIKIGNNVVNKLNEEHYNLMNMVFSREDALDVGLFDDRFKKVQSSTPYILFIRKLIKKGISIKFNDKLVVDCKDKNLYKKNLEESLLEKYKDEEYKPDILNRIMVPASIIIPSNKSLSITPNEQDEIIQFQPFKSDMGETLYKKIQNAKHKCIIVLNPDVMSERNVINVFKENCNKNMILIDNNSNAKVSEFDQMVSEVSSNKIGETTSACFSKSLVKGRTSGGEPDLPSTLKNIAIKSGKQVNMVNSLNRSSNKNSSFIISGIGRKNPTNKQDKRFNQLKKKDRIEREKKEIRAKRIKNRRIKPGKVKRKTAKEKFGMSWKNVNALPKTTFTNRKPKIALICDVVGWAWWNKSMYLKEQLKKYYIIDVLNLIGPNKSQLKDNYDIFFTYGHSFVDRITKFPAYKRVTGVTAHRPESQLKPQMQKAAVTHANSMLLYNELKRYHNIPYYVPNGVDLEMFKQKKPLPMRRKKKITVGVVGKLSARKKQSEILFPAIEKAGVLSVKHMNNYINKLDHEFMVDVYQDFDVLLTASIEDGTPCPNLESAACGRPIITNSIGNMPELIKDGINGFINPSMTPSIDWYVEKILYLQDNPEVLYKMSKNIKNEIKKWSWELQAKNYMKMFDDILGIKRDKEIYDNPSLLHLKEKK